MVNPISAGGTPHSRPPISVRSIAIGECDWLECRFDVQLDASLSQRIKQLFDPFRPFHYGIPFDESMPIPFPTFLGQSFHSRTLSRDEYGSVLKDYGLSGSQIVDPNKLTSLRSERDALEMLFSRVVEQLEDVVDDAKSVIKVWAIEALDNLPERSHRDVRWFARRLWTMFVFGNPIDWPLDGEDVGRFVLHEQPFPWNKIPLLAQLSRIQREGLMFYAHVRDHISEPAKKVNARRYAIELISLKSLLREPLPTFTEIEEKLIREEEYHERTMKICSALRDYHNNNKPHFSTYSQLYEWAMEIDNSGPGTIKNLLMRADLFIEGKRGRSGGGSLKQMIKKMIECAPRHEKTKNNPNLL